MCVCVGVNMCLRAWIIQCVCVCLPMHVCVCACVCCEVYSVHMSVVYVWCVDMCVHVWYGVGVVCVCVVYVWYGMWCVDMCVYVWYGVGVVCVYVHVCGVYIVWYGVCVQG